MCSHYQSLKNTQQYGQTFGVEPPQGEVRPDMWPGYQGAFIRRHPNADVGDHAVPAREALTGVFGLLPHWAKDEKLARSTYNCRSETAATKPSFRDAWKRGQHCIIPADAIFEPDWRSGKSVPTRIAQGDGEPMGIAGLWERWTGPQGVVHSFTMLTVNADDNKLMRNFHKPQDEKRMVVILPVAQFDEWLDAGPEHSMEFMREFSADRLVAHAEPRKLPSHSAA